MSWLIAYDITCPRRWRRLYRLVREYGVRVQWSVFLVTREPFQRAAFLSAASRIIDAQRDDLRLYRLAGKLEGSRRADELIAAPAGVHWRPPRGARPAIETDA